MVAYWISCIIFIGLMYDAIRYLRANKQAVQENTTFFTWAFSIGFMIFITAIMLHLFLWIGNGSTQARIDYLHNMYQKAGMTIVWAVCSFGMMWLGMRFRFKPLRVVSLTLFTLALLKLFLFDLRNINEGGKIAAFIMLGVLLLIISFMYQRLKKLFINDEEKGA